jgi:hypothetical protein
MAASARWQRASGPFQRAIYRRVAGTGRSARMAAVVVVVVAAEVVEVVVVGAEVVEVVVVVVGAVEATRM